jgi:hypothetical protein
MANAPDPFYDGNKVLFPPSVPLSGGSTGHMFFLDRGPTQGGKPGTTGVDAVYMDPAKLQELFAGMGGRPRTYTEVRKELEGKKFRPGVDYTFHPYSQVPTSIQAPDKNPPVGNAHAMVNALARGAISTATGRQSRNMANALGDYAALNEAIKYGPNTEVTDMAHELSIRGRGDLINNTPDQILESMPRDTQRIPGPTYVPMVYDGRLTDPTYQEALKVWNEAKAEVDRVDEFNATVADTKAGVDEIKAYVRKPNFMGPPGRSIFSNAHYLTSVGNKADAWTRSLTQEQRDALTPEQIDAKINGIAINNRAKEIVHTFTRKAESSQLMDIFKGQSKSAKLYGSSDDAGYGDVWEKEGLMGLGTLLSEQALESAPNTVATMMATSAVSLATGGAAIPVALGMGGSTALSASNSNFTAAFSEWATLKGIEMSELNTPAGMKKLTDIVDQDPSGFMRQMNAMASEGDKRAIAEGVVTIALNKAGDWATGKVTSAAPKAFREGSPLVALRGGIARPAQMVSGEYWKLSLGPKLASAALNTGWEAVEEGLTDVITSIAVGDDVEMKGALSSFLVGGLMGSGSNVVAGVKNIDDPLASMRDNILNNEGGIDEVAEQIAKNTGMPVERAKAALIRAKTMMDHFEELKKQHPDPATWPKLKQDFLQGVADSAGALNNYLPDQQQIYMSEARAAQKALMEELRVKQLEAWNQANVTPDPRIKQLGDYLFRQNSNPAPGFDPARYK